MLVFVADVESKNDQWLALQNICGEEHQIYLCISYLQMVHISCISSLWMLYIGIWERHVSWLLSSTCLWEAVWVSFYMYTMYGWLIGCLEL